MSPAAPATTDLLFQQILAEVSPLMAKACRQAGARGDDHPLSQPGLEDGEGIVLDYLAHGEAAVALDHLLYMISEPPLTLSATGLDRLAMLRRLYGM